MRGRSSMDNVLMLSQDITQQMALKNIVVAVFLDTKAAFDSVTHDATCREMTAAGIRGQMFKRLRDYLQDRTVYMATTSGDTTRHAIRQGVLQGGVLSPTLLSICLVGLPKVLPSGVNVSLYADDICVWCSGRNQHTSEAATGDPTIGAIPEELWTGSFS